MPSGKYHSDYEKGKIGAFEKSGNNVSEISKQINCSRTVNKNFFQKECSMALKNPQKEIQSLIKEQKEEQLA